MTKTEIQTSFKWIRQIILSPLNITKFHLQCCEKLIELFEKQYEDDPDCIFMVIDLKGELREKETFLTIEV